MRWAVVVIFCWLAVRVFLDYQHQKQTLEALHSQFDKDNDHIMSAGEVLSWVNKNMHGDPMTTEKFNTIFGSIDNEKDGFDDEEILELADALDELPTASSYMKELGGDRQEHEYTVTVVGAVIYFILLVANFYLIAVEERQTKMSFDSQKKNEARILRTLEEKRHENQELQQNIASHQSKMKDLEEKIKKAPEDKRKSLQAQHDDFANMVATVQADLDNKSDEIGDLSRNLAHERAKWNKHMTGIDAIRNVFKLQQKGAPKAADKMDGATQGCNFEVKIFGGVSEDGTLQMFVHENVVVQVSLWIHSTALVTRALSLSPL
jgi:hypothetical protein